MIILAGWQCVVNEVVEMRAKTSILAVLFILSFGVLSACDTAEERAEKHFQSALVLLEKGDVARATVEFRNVFKLNGQHKDARAAYANMLRESGNVRAAMGQYLRLVEQYPDDLDGQRAVAEIYAEIGKWAEIERHLAVILDKEPNDATARPLKVVFDYQTALADGETQSAGDAVKMAVEMRAELPEHILLRQVVIDDHIRNSNFRAALTELDEAIKVAPENRVLYGLRLSVLSALKDPFAIETQLKDMIIRFPDDNTSRATLVRWYVSQGQLDEAELFLRDAIDPADTDTTNQVTLLQFLTELRGRDVALAEVRKIIAEGLDAPLILALKAGLEFESGNHDAAIDQMQNALEALEPSEEAHRIKTALAQMLLRTGNSVGARAAVEEILAEDAGHLEALKLKAGWQIDDDQVGDAILALRSALDSAPRDPAILTLMARAYDRDGSQELVGEMLSLAVEASNRAPSESLRYTKYLINLKKYSTAEGILIDSLRLAPGNLEILSQLGGIYLATEDWPRAEQVVATLRRLDTPAGTEASAQLNVRLLQAQKKFTDAGEFLGNLLADNSTVFGAKVAIAQNHLSNGNADLARAFVRGLMNEDPDDLRIQFLDATIDAATGDLASAELKYRAILQKDNQQRRIWVALFQTLNSAGKTGAAEIAVDEARALFPDYDTLKWIKAGLLEASGDLDGAIAIYEGMYAKNSNNLVIANNLASLLSTHRDDPASIARADTIARRLRSSNVAPFQDTYGWIAYLRGDIDEALRALEPAATGLSEDPMVQYHLAMVYLAVDREDDAERLFRSVDTLTGPADTREFVEFSRAEIIRLQAE